MLTLIISFLYGFAALFLLTGAGSFFTEEEEAFLIRALSRGLLLMALFGFIVFLFPDTFILLIAISLLLFGLSLKKKWYLDPLWPGFFLFYTYVFLWQCLVPFYYGGGWYGDWFEHYQRTLFFLGKLPLDYRFLNLYGLLARTPLYHLLISFFLRDTHPEFYLYQALSTMLNTLFFLPFFSFLLKWQKEKFVFLLFLSPFVMRMATYTFPKALTAFFVLTALYLLLFDRKKKQFLEIGLLFGAAFLTHQSGFFYFVPVLIWLSLRRKLQIALKMALWSFVPAAVWIFFGALFFTPRELILQTPSISYERPTSWLVFFNTKALNIIGAFLPAAFFRMVKTALTYPEKMSSPLWLAIWDGWLNFAYGALPAVWTLSFALFALTMGKRSILLPRWIISFLLPFAFFCDILAANNAGVAIGVAQNGMMPLVLLFGLWLAARVDTLPFWFKAGIAVEFLLSFAGAYALFLFPGLYPEVLPYYKNNASLYHHYQILSLYDLLSPPNDHFLLLVAALIWTWKSLRSL